MRRTGTIAMGLAVAMAAWSLAGCTSLRTPYEQEKMSQEGAQKKAEGNEGRPGGGENKKTDKSQGQQGTTLSTKNKPAEKSTLDQVREKIQATKDKTANPDLLLTKPKAADEQTPKLMYSQTLSSEVAKLPGVENATVLLNNDHDAYVAVYSTANLRTGTNDASSKQTNKKLDVKTEGEVPSSVQQAVATKLRAADPLVGTVHITSDPHHVQSLQRYATQFASGEINNLKSQALAEHIEDIWK